MPVIESADTPICRCGLPFDDQCMKRLCLWKVEVDGTHDPVRVAVAVERERCAKIADVEPHPAHTLMHGAWDRGYRAGRQEAAAAIRKNSK